MEYSHSQASSAHTIKPVTTASLLSYLAAATNSGMSAASGSMHLLVRTHSANTSRVAGGANGVVHTLEEMRPPEYKQICSFGMLSHFVPFNTSRSHHHIVGSWHLPQHDKKQGLNLVLTAVTEAYPEATLDTCTCTQHQPLTAVAGNCTQV